MRFNAKVSLQPSWSLPNLWKPQGVPARPGVTAWREGGGWFFLEGGARFTSHLSRPRKVSDRLLAVQDSTVCHQAAMDPTRLKRGPKRSSLVCLAANDDEPEDGENNAPGHGQISGASSVKSTCQKARSSPHDGVLDAGFGDGGGAREGGREVSVIASTTDWRIAPVPECIWCRSDSLLLDA